MESGRAPFDAFDWQTRVLPGRIIAFGIGSMVAVIRALNLGPTSTTAKTAEQAMAIAEMFIAGVVGGFIVFLILRSARRVHGFAVGLALGFVLGLPAVLSTLHGSETASVGPWAGAVWVLAAFVVWGAVLGQSEQRLIGSDETTGAASDGAVRRIDRRRFLVQLGGTTAVITVAGAVVGELAEARRREAVMKAAEQFRLVFTLPDYLRDLYRSFGNALDRFHDEPEYRLLIPARYVDDKQGIIRAADVNADYSIVRSLPKLSGSCGC
jgi:hypothetical protein